MAKMVIVELRPGLTVQMTPAEVKARGLKPYEPNQTKKAAPSATKKRRKPAPVETDQEDDVDGLRND